MSNDTLHIAPCAECDNTLVSNEVWDGVVYFPAPCPCGGSPDYDRLRPTDKVRTVYLWDCYYSCSDTNKWQD